jgi:hypothetical protein
MVVMAIVEGRSREARRRMVMEMCIVMGKIIFSMLLDNSEWW